MNKKIIFSVLVILLVTGGVGLWARGHKNMDDGGRYGEWGEGDRGDGKATRGGFYDKDHSQQRERSGAALRFHLENFSKKVFVDVDTDNDSQVSENEYIAYRVDRAQKLVALHYGKLNDKKLDKIKERAINIFSRMDEDKNNSLSEKELIGTRLERFFTQFDANENGIIDQDEAKRQSLRGDSKRGK